MVCRRCRQVFPSVFWFDRESLSNGKWICIDCIDLPVEQALCEAEADPAPPLPSTLRELVELQPNRQSPTDGLALLITGVAIGLLGLWSHRAFGKLVTGSMLFFGSLMIRKGQQMRLPGIKEVLERDLRKPVVYLRSFGRDGVLAHSPPQIWAGFVTGAVKLASTSELAIKEIAKQAGPFIAIGNPLETYPSFGATRIYTGTWPWRAIAELLVREAQAIIIHPAGSQALAEELQMARGVLADTPVFLVFDGMKDSTFDAESTFAAQLLVQSVFGVQVPDPGALAQVLALSSKRQPRLFKANRGFLRPAYRIPVSDALHQAFSYMDLPTSALSHWNSRAGRAVIGAGLAFFILFCCWLFVTSTSP
jgi:hypothetical protein